MLITQIKKDKEASKAINIKLNAEERKTLQKQADKYANGNLSEWLRFAGTHFLPGKEHLVSTKKTKK
jgi:hypothetical protein